MLRGKKIKQRKISKCLGRSRFGILARCSGKVTEERIFSEEGREVRVTA